MKHAKDVASRNALELITAKLAESKFTYEEELEHISKQFEDMQKLVEQLKNDKIEMKREIVKLEGVITDLNSMIENTGYYQANWQTKQEFVDEKKAQAVKDL